MRMRRNMRTLVCAALLFGILLTGSGGEKEKEKKDASKKSQEQQEMLEREQDTQDAEEEKEISEEPEQETQEPKQRPQTVVIDPGHSKVVAAGTEPLGPGSLEQKAADASGTAGVSTGVPEYELTLSVSLKLREELKLRGYTVLMTRESNDVPVSCVQRADVANQAGADAYVRIHANGAENQSAVGAMTICITPQNPYVPGLYGESRRLSDCVIGKFCEAAGCENDGVWETDTMSGNNWSQVPTTIVEMGYMTNPEEDQKMQTREYQAQMVKGIADGLDLFFGY